MQMYVDVCGTNSYEEFCMDDLLGIKNQVKIRKGNDIYQQRSIPYTKFISNIYILGLSEQNVRAL